MLFRRNQYVDEEHRLPRRTLLSRFPHRPVLVVFLGLLSACPERFPSGTAPTHSVLITDLLEVKVSVLRAIFVLRAILGVVLLVDAS